MDDTRFINLNYFSECLFNINYIICTLLIRPANGSLKPGAAGLVVVLAGLVDPVGVEVGGPPPPPAGPAGLAAAEAAAAANSGRNIYSQC